MSTNQSKSKLFVSADLVGSTNYKQSVPGWQKIFLSFYREFPQYVQSARNSVTGIASSDRLKFNLWKAIGDELIFEIQVHDENEVSVATRIWLQALRDYEKEVLADATLSLKGGAFIATFPGPDSESTIPRNPESETSDDPVVLLNAQALGGRRAHKKYLYDYFGPSIDTGFRIVGHASQRYFTLTVEVAWAIASAAHTASAAPETENKVHHLDDFNFLGLFQLKGVWGGREYPIFAIDRQFDDPLNKAVKQLESNGIDAGVVLNVCSACHQDEGWRGAIYLPDSHSEHFKKEPEDAMRELMERESTHDGAESALNDDRDTNDGSPLPNNAPLGGG
ncbi:hypothetical protein [Glutamicibacter sp. FBE19]|uniref:hypothetical protein n=1 Tax=Glutamicibacter sp. FBE19 TaxID=2761534 RepID=UPI0018966280|nr:hypothetical protein [Glutamicibacter sp. FBE19]MBF6672460.1 hypothetical protein [Glutamicibacter sp. FBE19]